MILDIHSHKKVPQADAILNLPVAEFNPVERQAYSVGIHPWSLSASSDRFSFEQVEQITRHESVVAIGETGIDLAKDVPLYEQMLVFRRHISLSESIKKPMIIHCVRAHDIIAGLRKEFKPKMDWIIHGFRGKPTIAKILLDSGCHLSFGEHFNADSVAITPIDRLFVETDESELTIDEIIKNLSNIRHDIIPETIVANINRLLQR